MSDSLQPHGLQHARLLFAPHFPRVCSNLCPLSWWCYLTISFSAAVFSFCFQSLPESGSFPVSSLFTSGGQNTGDSASASVFSMNIQGWFPLGLTGFISLLSKGLSRVFSSTTIQKHKWKLPSWFNPKLELVQHWYSLYWPEQVLRPTQIQKDGLEPLLLDGWRGNLSLGESQALIEL